MRRVAMGVILCEIVLAFINLKRHLTILAGIQYYSNCKKYESNKKNLIKYKL